MGGHYLRKFGDQAETKKHGPAVESEGATSSLRRHSRFLARGGRPSPRSLASSGKLRLTLERLLERRYSRSFSTRCSVACEYFGRTQIHAGQRKDVPQPGALPRYTQPCARAPCLLLAPCKPPFSGTAPAGLQPRPQSPPLREQTRPLRHAQRSASGVGIRRVLEFSYIEQKKNKQRRQIRRGITCCRRTD